MDVERYLERLRLTPPAKADAAALLDLHQAHLLHVPFENLSIHWREPMTLATDHLFRKIVEARRGGFCYECNGLFAALLHALGFGTTLLSARVARDAGGFSPEFDHLVLLVELERPWLVDVGFGQSFRTPMPLVTGHVHADPGGEYRLLEAGGIWTLEGRTAEGTWTPRFAFERLPRRIEDFQNMFEFHRDAPTSHFHKAPLATIATGSGRTTLSGRRLIRTAHDGSRQAHELPDEEIPAALAREFGIVRTVPAAPGTP
ncbi:arylamine N-acetyltransferase family protein [Luteimonas deserti]|uniref:Arylamine N-acetyltransferase n=1 Tax=Luteimonas deserti TaxID=2752306 RepID=A0A7Z0TVH7_9GAMM|nr:arylamine N-acetyltransferase [Luteimonas deserti]NYZ63876.1 arylamine N-acetyltransferase [Luteimonas deserti]